MNKKSILIAGLMMALTACSSTTQETQYYALALPTETLVQPTVNQQPVVQIRDIQLADYLNTVGVVYQQNDVQLVSANQHRWAEALDKQLTRAMLSSLKKDLPAYQWQNTTNAADVPQLQVIVTGFQGKYDGHAVIQGNWQLDVKQQHFSGDFSQDFPVKDDGYPALVRTLSQGWQQTIEHISHQIQPLLPTKKAM